MNELEQARKRIDEIDEQIRALFIERMRGAAEIAAYKQSHGLPIYVPEREAEVLERHCALIGDPELRSCYELFQRHLMDISKEYQRVIISEPDGSPRPACGGELTVDTEQ